MLKVQSFRALHLVQKTCITGSQIKKLVLYFFTNSTASGILKAVDNFITMYKRVSKIFARVLKIAKLRDLLSDSTFIGQAFRRHFNTGCHGLQALLSL